MIIVRNLYATLVPGAQLQFRNFGWFECYNSAGRSVGMIHDIRSRHHGIDPTYNWPGVMRVKLILSDRKPSQRTPWYVYAPRESRASPLGVLVNYPNRSIVPLFTQDKYGQLNPGIYTPDYVPPGINNPHCCWMSPTFMLHE